jgi:hypothetical protein
MSHHQAIREKMQLPQSVFAGLEVDGNYGSDNFVSFQLGQW